MRVLVDSMETGINIFTPTERRLALLSLDKNAASKPTSRLNLDISASAGGERKKNAASVRVSGKAEKRSRFNAGALSAGVDIDNKRKHSWKEKKMKKERKPTNAEAEPEQTNEAAPENEKAQSKSVKSEVSIEKPASSSRKHKRDASTDADQSATKKIRVKKA